MSYQSLALFALLLLSSTSFSEATQKRSEFEISGILCRADSLTACRAAVSALVVVASTETDPSEASVGRFVVSYAETSPSAASFEAYSTTEGNRVRIVAGNLARGTDMRLTASVSSSSPDESLVSGLEEAAKSASATGIPDLSAVLLRGVDGIVPK